MSVHRKASRVVKQGQFVQSTENSLGFGKYCGCDGSVAFVEYFDSPVSPADLQEVNSQSIKFVVLPMEQRVYFKGQDGWKTGRVRHYQASDLKYLVQFPNRDSQLVAENELYTRCSKPIIDPTDYLALRINETAYWHAGRATFVNSLFQQRKVCGGMTALLCSSIDIERHQVAVVRRVMQDAIQRYLLADEVGLGKTIEAGLLIKQYVLDEPANHRVLIVTPSSLVEQWREELRGRFFLEDQLGKSIHVVPQADVELIRKHGRHARMIVVDEAHHVASGAKSGSLMSAAFDELVEITSPPDRRLLLLSATPALHNEEGFLALLHLLDPAVYSLSDIVSFRRRIEERQRIAEALSALQEHEPNLFLRQAVDDLTTLSPQDLHLTQSAHELLQYLENDPLEDDPRRLELIGRLRSHIGETWRLHRRILRTRRAGVQPGLLPERKGVEAREWRCDDYRSLDDVFSHWRVTAAQSIVAPEGRLLLSRLVCVLAEAISSDPEVVPHLIAFRLGRISELDGLALSGLELESLTSTPQFEGEVELLSRMARLCEDFPTYQREELIVQSVQVELNTTGRAPDLVVVFTNYASTADRLAKILEKRLGQAVVFRHTSQSTNWTQAITRAKQAVIVCDRTAEEGLNLQKRRSVLIHADLPLSLNRVEQRIGRLDRIGAFEVRSLVLVCPESETQSTWFPLVNDAFRIFHRSVASLQYFIEEEFSRLWIEYVDGGISVYEDRIPFLIGEDGLVEKELKRVRLQAELDSFDFDPRSDEQLVHEIQHLDFKSTNIKTDVESWICNRLHFSARHEKENRARVVRYQFCRRDDMRARSLFKDTLIPDSDLKRYLNLPFAPAIDVPKEVEYESSPIAFHRQDAKTYTARLARVGDPLIDGFARMLETDDRGGAFAFWRHLPEMIELDDPAELSFRFDFVVEADAMQAREVLDANLGAGGEVACRRLDESLRPFAVSIWLDSNLRRITTPERLDLLKRPYSSDSVAPTPYRFRDINLNRERWAVVRQWWDDEHWSRLCHRARESAEHVLREAHELHLECDRAVVTLRELSRLRLSSLESRAVLASGTTREHLQGEITLENQLLSAMEAGLRQPVVRLDSLGAVFLSRQNPFPDRSSSTDDE